MARPDRHVKVWDLMMLRESLQRLGLPWEFAREVASDVFAQPVRSMSDLNGSQVKELRRLFPPVPRHKL